jgi:hypothetical protein
MSGFHSDEVGLSLGGKSFILAWTQGSKRIVQTKSGKPLKQIAAEWEKEPDNADILIIFLYAAMSRHHKDLLIEDVQAMIDDLSEFQFAQVAAKLAESIYASRGPGADLPQAPPPKAGKNGPLKGRSSNT